MGSCLSMSVHAAYAPLLEKGSFGADEANDLFSCCKQGLAASTSYSPSQFTGILPVLSRGLGKSTTTGAVSPHRNTENNGWVEPFGYCVALGRFFTGRPVSFLRGSVLSEQKGATRFRRRPLLLGRIIQRQLLSNSAARPWHLSECRRVMAGPLAGQGGRGKYCTYAHSCSFLRNLLEFDLRASDHAGFRFH